MIQESNGHENLSFALPARFLYEDSPLLFTFSFSPSPSVGVSERRKSLGARREREREKERRLPLRFPSSPLTLHFRI